MYNLPPVPFALQIKARLLTTAHVIRALPNPRTPSPLSSSPLSSGPNHTVFLAFPEHKGPWPFPTESLFSLAPPPRSSLSIGLFNCVLPVFPTGMPPFRQTQCLPTQP